jgi:antitoxin FitA
MEAHVSLSVKDVPGEWAEALRARARANHRSLQGELMAMIEAYVGGRPFPARNLIEKARAAGLGAVSDATEIVRAERDQR